MELCPRWSIWTHVEKGTDPKLPADLRKILDATAQTKAQWDGLTPIGRRDFVSWIESAKQRQTRKRRVESVPSRLASGKRQPCCYATVPINLYTALKAHSKAKAHGNSFRLTSAATSSVG